MLQTISFHCKQMNWLWGVAGVEAILLVIFRNCTFESAGIDLCKTFYRMKKMFAFCDKGVYSERTSPPKGEGDKNGFLKSRKK